MVDALLSGARNEKWIKFNKNDKKMKHKNVAIWKAALAFVLSESNVTKLYSNIETLINVPLLILRKIKYLQFTEILNSNK